MSAATKRKTIHRKPLPLPTLHEQIEGLTDAVLMCRDMGHAWGVQAPFYIVEVEGGVRGAKYAERVCGCLRCDTQRIELYRVFKEHLEKLSNRYIYPDAYKLFGPKGARGETRQKARKEAFDRAMRAIRELEQHEANGTNH